MHKIGFVFEYTISNDKEFTPRLSSGFTIPVLEMIFSAKFNGLLFDGEKVSRLPVKDLPKGLKDVLKLWKSNLMREQYIYELTPMLNREDVEAVELTVVRLSKGDSYIKGPLEYKTYTSASHGEVVSHIRVVFPENIEPPRVVNTQGMRLEIHYEVGIPEGYIELMDNKLSPLQEAIEELRK